MFRKERSLYLKSMLFLIYLILNLFNNFLLVGEAKNLPEPMSTFCTVTVDDIQRARTPTAEKSDNPGFFHEYDMELDMDSQELCIYLKSQKNKSDIIIGSIKKKISDISPNSNDEWVQLISPEGKNVGSMRVKLQYFEVIVLPDQSYDDLFACLVKDKLLKTKMFTFVASKDAKFISDCLVKAFEMRKLATHYVKEIISAEIQGTGDVNIIFRGNSVATKSLDIFMKLVGTQYLLKVLKPIITEISQGKRSCELDAPNRCKENQVQGNLQNLKYFVKKVLDAIFGSFKICPASFRNVFRHIQETVVGKFPNEDVARYTAPSGFIFLRFFCPAILNPSLFDLLKEHPSEKVSRDFTLIAKTVQNIANLATFGKKEPYMECLNPFILECIPLMKNFINELCSPPSEPIDEIPYNNNINFGREMAKIHKRINEAIPDLKEKYGEDDPNVLDLIEVVEKLNDELKNYQSDSSQNNTKKSEGIVTTPPQIYVNQEKAPQKNTPLQTNDVQITQPTTEGTITNRRREIRFTPLEVPDSRKFWT